MTSAPRIPHRWGRRWTIARSTVVLAAALVLAISGAGVTGAFLNDSETVPGATLTAGNSQLLVGDESSEPVPKLVLPPSIFAGMLPGDVVGRNVTIVNDGDVALSVSTSTTDLTAWEVRVALGTCQAGAIGGPPLSANPIQIAANLPAAESVDACLEVSLPVTAPATTENTSAGITLVLDGGRVAP